MQKNFIHEKICEKLLNSFRCLQILNLSIENKKLAEMRDLLLPRVLNGEIDVSAVEI